MAWIIQLIAYLKAYFADQRSQYQSAPMLTVTIKEIPPSFTPPSYLWDNVGNARHSVRVICDEEGLPLTRTWSVEGKLYLPKDILCMCIDQESGFNNKAVNENKDAQGVVTSRDWGICQINDYWQCGLGKPFPSSAYVVAHPEEAVRFMVKMMKIGKIDLWDSYKSGAYKKFAANYHGV